MGPHALLRPRTGGFAFSPVVPPPGERHFYPVEGGPSWSRTDLREQAGALYRGKGFSRLPPGAHGPWPLWEGGAPTIAPSCGCNWFSSLSLPPLPLCVFPMFASLPRPCASLPPPTLFLLSAALGGAPFSRLPFSCTWSCLLSRCLPQEVGTRPVFVSHH